MTMLRLILPLLTLLPQAQDEPRGPRDGVFLLRNVAVWQTDGVPTEGRSVLVRNGLVEAIGGAEMSAPPEARLVEAGEDWVVYPGLIHGGFASGLEEWEEASPYADEASDPQVGPIPEMERGDRKDLRAWLHATDRLAWQPDQHADWRELGFTSVYVVPQEGLLRGRAAWVSLNERPLGQALLERDGLLTIGLTTRGSGYPRTPMGALATLRQAFLDAERLERLSRTGARRAVDDPDLQALTEEPGGALLFAADSAREIENALDLVRDYAPGRRLVIYGGRQAHAHLDRIVQQRAAVLFTLELEDAPEPDEELDLAEAAERPWWQDPARLRDERRRRHAEQVARFEEIRASGAPCALVPAGKPKELADGLAQLVEAGLGPDEILQALSGDLAAVLGLPSPRQLAAGAPADFFVSRGTWDPAEPDLAWVFADGRAWELPAKKDGGKRKGGEDDSDDDAGGAQPARPDLDGEWELSADFGGEVVVFRVLLDSAAEQATLFRVEEPGDTVTVSGIEIREDGFAFDFEPPDMEVEIHLTVEVFGEDAEATLGMPGMGTTAAEGHRVGLLPERGEVAAAEQSEDEPDGEPDAAALPLGHPEYPVETPADRRPATDLDGTVLLKGGTLYTMTGEEPFVGDLLIQGGLIQAVGREIHLVREVPTIDVRGLHVMPGVLDAHSHLALDSVNEGTVSITAECRIADMIHPERVEIFRAAAGGTAVAQALHGSANPIGGQAAVWELDVNRSSIAELLLPEAPQGIKFALGENVKRSNFGRFVTRFPASRSGVEAVYRRAFTRAQEYARERSLAAEGRNPGFRRDVRLDALADILEHEIHIQCHSYRADELLMFLGICEEFGIRDLTFQHVLEGYKVARELAEFGAKGSTFSDWWAYKIEAYDAIPWNPYLMHKAGVIASINSDSDEMIRRLNTEAGKSLLYGGMSQEDAMALCTLNSAKQLLVEEHLGSLEAGKHGTVTVYDAPPLSTYARCMLTLARGRVLFEHDPQHDAEWEEYADRVNQFAQSAALAAEGSASEEEGSNGHAAAAPARSEEEWEGWTHAGSGLSYLIRDARVHPISGAAFDGSVLIQDGRIAWVGETSRRLLPEGCVEVDAGGLHLYPGFINAGDRIGLYEIGSVRGTRDSSEIGDWQPDLSISTAIHADSAHFPVHRMTGITTALVHGTRGTITGQAALVHLDGEVTPDLVAAADLALHVRFPGVKRPDPGDAPEDPEGLAELDEWFERALEYGEMLERFDAAGRDPGERDLKLEALLPYARGEKPVLLESRDWRTLARAHQWALARGVEVVHIGPRDAWKVAGLLGRDGARVVVGPVHALPRRGHDPYDSVYRNPWILAEAGCEVALQTEDPEVTRNLPFQAATAATHGWGRDQALRALTLGAAEVLGVADVTGSIEAGKVADLFLCTGDPLDFESEVTRMWIGGREVELVSKQTELRDRYEERIDAASR